MNVTAVVLGFLASALSSIVAYLLGRKKQDASAAKDLVDSAMALVTALRTEVAELKVRVFELEKLNAELSRQLHLRMDLD